MRPWARIALVTLIRYPDVMHRPAPSLDTPIIAIGDIHGRADLLDRLLSKIAKEFGTTPHQLVFLGDYVDRGPDSRAVLDRLVDLRATRPGTVLLKGNHEQAMLDFLAAGPDADAWISWGGEETLLSYSIELGFPFDLVSAQRALADALPAAHFDLLMTLALTHQAPGYFFVHAGVAPTTPLELQQESDLLWIRDKFFDEGEARFPDTVIVHGHTPVKKAEDHGWRINVDTGAVWTGRLTAVVLGQGKPRFLTT